MSGWRVAIISEESIVGLSDEFPTREAAEAAFSEYVHFLRPGQRMVTGVLDAGGQGTILDLLHYPHGPGAGDERGDG